jgi:RNA polymerase sigma factor (TIGR02999 family)
VVSSGEQWCFKTRRHLVGVQKLRSLLDESNSGPLWASLGLISFPDLALVIIVGDFTLIFNAVQHGDPKAAEELLPLVYEELRRLAAAKMAHEAPGQTLQPTALVHEAWLRLAGATSQGWNGREHFFRASAEAMRRILVDRARQRAAEKRGGNPHRTELSESKVQGIQNDEQILAVHEALDQLALRDPVSADLVKLRNFVGLSMAEAAESLGLPLRTAERQWTFAKAWLRQQINQSASR